MMELSDRQVRVREFVREYVDENGYPPTFREIGRAVGITSTSVVRYTLDALEKAGILRRAPNRSRALALQARRSRRGVHGE